MSCNTHAGSVVSMMTDWGGSGGSVGETGWARAEADPPKTMTAHTRATPTVRDMFMLVVGGSGFEWHASNCPGGCGLVRCRDRFADEKSYRAATHRHRNRRHARGQYHVEDTPACDSSACGRQRQANQLARAVGQRL